VAIVSNYNWTEEQFKAAMERGKKRSQEDWLDPSVFRVGNKKDDQEKKAKASDIRWLMSRLVEEGYAFDNGDSSDRGYKISFNWAAKNELLEEWIQPRFFSAGLLSSPALLGLLSDEKLIFKHWDWDHKARQALLMTRTVWELILSALVVLDETGVLGIAPCFESQLEEEAKENILLMANVMSCMYKALEIGWAEISKDLYKDFHNHDALFIVILEEWVHAVYMDSVYSSELKPYADLKRIQRMNTILQFGVDYVSKLAGKLPENMRGILSGNEVICTITGFSLADPRAISRKKPWHRDLSEKLIPVFLVLLKSRDPKVRKAGLDWIESLTGAAPVFLRSLRRKIDKKTKANKLDK
jgi:hypothetical protein